jgi:hypothetical protein
LSRLQRKDTGGDVWIINSPQRITNDFFRKNDIEMDMRMRDSTVPGDFQGKSTGARPGREMVADIEKDIGSRKLVIGQPWAAVLRCGFFQHR